jgi:hypothetical protein
MSENQASPFVTLSENLPFHDFDAYKTFIGIFEKSLVLGKSEPFTVNVMKNAETNERVFIKDAYTIRESIAKCKAEHENLQEIVFQIIFEGKTEVKGKPFNKFTVGYCTLEAYNAIKASHTATTKKK